MKIRTSSYDAVVCPFCTHYHEGDDSTEDPEPMVCDECGSPFKFCAVYHVEYLAEGDSADRKPAGRGGEADPPVGEGDDVARED